TMTTFHNRQQINSTAKYVCATKMQRQYQDCPMSSIAINRLEQQVFHIMTDYFSAPAELSRLSRLIYKEISNRQQTLLRKKRMSKIDKKSLINQLAAGHITSKQFQIQIHEYTDDPVEFDDVLTLKEIHSK